MECPRCRADIREASRFCDECGSPSRAQCSSCGGENRPDAKFCSQCGIGLSEPTAKAGAAAGATAVRTSSAERRQLTVMFVDLVGSTALSARVDPEDLREVLGAYHKCVAETVRRFHGFVANYMGDGVLVYFGYPRAHEDDAEQAVRAALELVTAVSALKSPACAELQSRVGIATGLVVVGDQIGAGGAREHSVVGETPNLAARLQSAAEPNGVVIAATTRRLTGGLFEYDHLGALAAKGFAEPIDAWRVRGESAIASRFEALRSGEAPLIGREEEAELLLRRWQRAKGGEGQMVGMSGEAGIGKSRLTAAFEDCIAHEPHTSLHYFCLPHYQDSSLHPIIARLERSAGLERDDNPELKLDKLEALLAQTMPPTEDRALLAELLSLPIVGRYPPPNLPSQRQKALTFEALLRQLEVLARRRPVLMIFEDAHWIDPTSREWLDRVTERVRDLPILFIATFRPEFQPPWTGQAHSTMLMLNRLDRHEGALLAQQIAGEQLPSDVLAAIVDRADGVPLFVEELTRAVLDASEAGGRPAVAAVPSPTPMVPFTLHGSLMARLDRLGPRAKEVAQIGAAIGREFTYELLATVSGLQEIAMNEALDQLSASGLVFRRGTPPEVSFLFKHALIQDAAYNTLLRAQRQELHTRIAAAMEKRLADGEAVRPELLAHHLTEAGRPEKAVSFWTAAGDRALGRAAHREASAFFGRALGGLVPQEEIPETLAATVDLRRRLHQALYPLGQLQQARANLVEAERTAERLDDAVRLSRVLSSQIYVLSATGDLAGAVAAGERALTLLAEWDDLDAAVNTRLMLARALYAAGRYREAVGRAREAANLLGEDVDRGALGGLNYTVSARVWLALCHAERGEFEAGSSEGEAAMRLACISPAVQRARGSLVSSRHRSPPRGQR